MKRFYFYVLLLISNICMAQSEVTNLKIKSEPATLDNKESIDVLVRENSGVKKGTVRKVSWPYLAGIFGSSLIPLSGTTTGNPVTGDIEFLGYRKFLNGSSSKNAKLFISEDNIGFQTLNSVSDMNYASQYIYSSGIYQNVYSPFGIASVAVTNNTVQFSSGGDGYSSSILVNPLGVSVTSNNPSSKGISSEIDYTANISPLDYTQKKYVDTALQSGLSTKITNGGNAFGVPMLIGTSDNQPVTFKFNNFSVFGVVAQNMVTLPNGGILGNAANAARGNLTMSTSTEGVSVKRNTADAGAAFVALNQHASSTGNIAGFSSNIAGTTAVRSAVTKSGNLHFISSSTGIVLTSPDGTKYLITVADGGTLQSAVITTP